MDETSKQLLKETRLPIPLQPRKTSKYDYEYERGGVTNIFMVFAPIQGIRYVKVTNRRTKILVMDNFNTHQSAGLYEAFLPQEARRILERLNCCYIPKHGS